MVDKNRELVLVLENENDSKKLFKIWNSENKINVECSEDGCKNDVDGNAYIVTMTNADKKFILPLCYGCYKTHNNSKNQLTSNLRSSSTILGIDKKLLMEY